MKLPFIVYRNLDEMQIKKWNRYYSHPVNDWDRKIEEGLWRRTQEFGNREESGWQSPNDKRRRMVHYIYQYNISLNDNNKYDLVLEEIYIWIHLCNPVNEIDKYYENITKALHYNQWNAISKKNSKNERSEFFTKNDLCYQINRIIKHPQDIASNRIFPDNYCILEITLQSLNFQIDDNIKQKPWGILNSGTRKKDIRGNAFVDENLEKIPSFFPAQIELGCGPSIEAGIPPLNFLHDIYYVDEKNTQKFIFGADRDKLAEKLALNTEQFFNLLTKMYKKCFLAKPTIFHKILKNLFDNNYCVNPIITNNFDGLPMIVGLEEKYVRRYETTHIVPDINFHPKAKSLIVVGSHADRRRIQAAARQKGLQVIYIDPEGYFEKDVFVEYKLESPQDEDIIYRKGASQAFKDIYEKINLKKSILNNGELLIE